MARFRGILQGGRGEVTRLGHASSGLRVCADGWDVGVTVYAQANGADDIFSIYATRGSNGRASATLLGTVQLVDGSPRFIPNEH